MSILRLIFCLYVQTTCVGLCAADYKHCDRNTALHFLQQFIEPRDLVFDVGANIGAKAELYLACGAKTICFEPQSSCVQKLKQRFALDSRVIVEPVGLADKAGTLELLICPQASTLATFSKQATESGRFFEQNYHWNRKETVSVYTLDEMIAKYGLPAFCKIDVEGFELQVLQGLSEPIRCISFESTSEHMNKTFACIDYLSGLGYTKFNFSIGESCVFAFSSWLDAASFKQQLAELASSRDWSKIWDLWGDAYAYYSEV